MIWALLLLAIVLLMFLLVPVWYRRPQDVNDQSEENLRLYEERSREVAASDLDDARKQACQATERPGQRLAAIAPVCPFPGCHSGFPAASCRQTARLPSFAGRRPLSARVDPHT